MAGTPFQAHPRWERVWADPDMGAILPKMGLVRGGIFSSLFVAVDKKGLARLLIINYSAKKALVCENLSSQKIKYNYADTLAIYHAKLRPIQL